MQTRTIGGVNETDVKELAVSPCGSPSGPRTVVTVIPVAKRAQARRKLSGSTDVQLIPSVTLDNVLTLILS